ncbi:MAG: 23S rRNA (adenine(2503)-C(2))-methyltransferase RlmN [Lentisphaerae bacterium]|nr:23S rRNA (adenine(2503)-C(2))-methyltransferase RlmN [Lentisphaerota bacterium]
MSTLANIKDLDRDTLAAFLDQHGFPPFRCQQIMDWLYQKWCIDFKAMSNLPKALQELLGEHFRASALQVQNTQQAEDGTVKWLCRLADGETIETVLIPAPERSTVCISTQVGCAVRCAFCASGKQGLVRNLSRSEIIEQVLLACRYQNKKITNVVVMGMGEPMHNLENLLPALELLSDPGAFGLGARHITVSTSGIVSGIRALADCRRAWNLAISLHATSDEQRSRIIPPQHRCLIADILSACKYFRERTNRMPTLEYTLLAGINDRDEDAIQLARLARQFHAKVNLIPCNNDTGRYQAPAPAHCRQFLERLQKLGAQATLRLRKGGSIQAACGQLRQQNQPPAPGNCSPSQDGWDG